MTEDKKKKPTTAQKNQVKALTQKEPSVFPSALRTFIGKIGEYLTMFIMMITVVPPVAFLKHFYFRNPNQDWPFPLVLVIFVLWALIWGRFC